MKTFIALALLSTSAFATELRCSLTVGEDTVSKTVEVTSESMTEINFGTRRGYSFIGTAVYESVNVYVKSNGTTFGTSKHKGASIDVFPENQEPISLSCRLVEEPIGC